MFLKAREDGKDEHWRWFRPSDVCVGAEGALYVADWYDPGVGRHAAGDKEARGRILRSPCHTFYLQLIEPDPDTYDFEHDELLQRIGFGAPDVPRAVAELRKRGVGFVEAKDGPHTEARGALTQTWLNSVLFELVHDERSS